MQTKIEDVGHNLEVIDLQIFCKEYLAISARKSSHVVLLKD
jgi:hypothetical protein